MSNITDINGYNQIFKPSLAMRVRTELRAVAITSKMREGDKLNILEIGCGTGEMAFFLSEILSNRAKIYAIDVCADFITKAKAKYESNNLEFFLSDFNKVDNLPLTRFDYIVGNGILHHVYHNIDVALKNLRMLLNPGGKIIFFEPNIYNPYCYMIFNFFRDAVRLDPEEMAFSKNFISEHLNQIEFDNIEVEYRDFLLPNTPDYLIKSLCFFGGIAERIPIIKMLSQSILISATRPLS